MSIQPNATHDLPLCHLTERALVKVAGDDAAAFLQNLVTNDITKLAASRALYACLLTPQGRFLHDFFISGAPGGGMFLECEAARRDDLIRRLTMFRLRSKVAIEKIEMNVYVTGDARHGAFEDPRLPALGHRFYTQEELTAQPAAVYRDRRIALGIPEGTPDMEVEGDTAANLNLDRLNAVSWDKGCYLGQEITAMTQNRGTVKKRMAIVSGHGLTPGELLHDGHAVGDIRSVNSDGSKGLAVIKLASLGAVLTTAAGASATAHLPGWLNLENE